MLVVIIIFRFIMTMMYLRVARRFPACGIVEGRGAVGKKAKDGKF